MKKLLSLLLAVAMIFTLPMSDFMYGSAKETIGESGIKEPLILDDGETYGPVTFYRSERLFVLEPNVPVVGEAPQLLNESFDAAGFTVKDQWLVPSSKGSPIAVKKFQKGVTYIYTAAIQFKKSAPDGLKFQVNIPGMTWNNSNVSQSGKQLVFTARTSIDYEVGDIITDSYKSDTFNNSNTFKAVVTKGGKPSSAECKLIVGDEANSASTYTDKLELPATLNGVKVTAIDDDAFKECTNITNIKMGENITKVGARAFMTLPDMKSITLTDTITDVGDKAFGYLSDTVKVNNFRIHAVKGSAAYTYAFNEGFARDFIITDVTIHDVKYPVDTEKAKTSGIWIHSDQGTINSKTWCLLNGDESVDLKDGTAFAADNTYFLHIEFTPPSNTSYSEYMTAENVHINDEYTVTRLYKQGSVYVIHMQYEKLSPKADVTINEVNFTNVEEPVAGEKAVAPKLKIGSNQGKIVDVRWLDSGNVFLNENDVFEEGKVYKLGIDFKPDMYKVYADKSSLKVTFNGNNATSVTLLGNDNTERTYTAKYQFGPAKKTVKEVTLTGVTLPEVGDTPVTNFTKSTPAMPEEQGSIYTRYWRRYNAENSLETVYNYDTFELGKEYAIIFIIAPPENGKFSDTLKATVNGKEAIVESVEGSPSRRSVTLSFGVLKNYIDKVEINGVVAPEVGKAPVTSGIGFKEACGCKLDDIHWEYVVDGDPVTLGDDDVFEYDKTYSIVMMVEPEEEFTTFSDTAKVTVNGSNPTSFTKDSGSEAYILTITYDPIPDPNATPAPTAEPTSSPEPVISDKTPEPSFIPGPDITPEPSPIPGTDSTPAPATAAPNGTGNQPSQPASNSGNNASQAGTPGSSNGSQATQTTGTADTGSQAASNGPAKQKIKVIVNNRKINQTTLQKKKLAVKCIIVKKAKTKVTYTLIKTGSSKKITVNAKNGKINLPKGLKKGKYTVKVKITAKATKDYKAATKTVTVKIEVK